MFAHAFYSFYREVQNTPEYINDSTFFIKVSSAYTDALKDPTKEKLEALYQIVQQQFPANPELNQFIEKLRDISLERSNLSENIQGDNPLIEVKLPSLHAFVNKKDLQKNGMLFSDNHLLILEIFSLGEEKQVFFSKSEVPTLPYDAFRINRTFYACYAELGKGGNGTVYLAQNLQDGSWHAVKNEKKYYKFLEKIPKEKIDNMLNFPPKPPEVEILSELENDIGLEQMLSFKEDSSELYFEHYFNMQLAFGIPLSGHSDLLGRKPSSYELLNIAELWVSAAKKDLDEYNLLHCDHKGRNCIYDAIEQKIRLIDRGSSKITDENKQAIDKQISGTPGFIAPELVKVYKSPEEPKKYIYNEKTEVFALGKAIALVLGLAYIKRTGEGIIDQECYFFQDLSDYREKNSKNPNPFLPEPFFSAAIKILKKMTAENPGERLTMEEAMQAFQKLKAQALWLRSRIKKIGIVDLHELMGAEPNSSLSELEDEISSGSSILRPLRKMNEIWIVDPTQESQDISSVNINKVIRSLEMQGITVAGVMSSSERASFNIDEKSNEIVSFLEKRNAGQFINNYFHISKNEAQLANNSKLHPIVVKEESDYDTTILNHLGSSEISERHYEWVIRHLHKEIAHVNADWVQLPGHKVRLTALKATMQSLQESFKNHTLTYTDLNTRLEELEKQMVHLNPLKYAACSLFNSKHDTKAASYIAEMRNDISPAHQLTRAR